MNGASSSEPEDLVDASLNHPTTTTTLVAPVVEPTAPAEIASILEETHQMLSFLEDDDDDNEGMTAGGMTYDGFAIDSDDDDIDIDTTTKIHNRTTTTPTAAVVATSEDLPPFLHPFSDECTSPTSTTNTSNRTNHSKPPPPPPTNSLQTAPFSSLGSGNLISSSSGVTPHQPTTMMTTTTTTTSSAPSSLAEGLGFANMKSGFANFAKSAASQIDKMSDKIAHQSAVVGGGGGSPIGATGRTALHNNHTNNNHSLLHATTHPTNVPHTTNSPTTHTNHNNTNIPPPTATTATNAASLPPPPPSLIMELDNEQKEALIQTHIGTLLAGERCIMFLSNLLHVTDSTNAYATLQKTAAASGDANSGSNNGMWCCVMTYFRLVLFHTSSIDFVLQMPLASMDKVEKSIYTAPSSSLIRSVGNHTNNKSSMGTNPTTLMGLAIHGKDNGRQIRFTAPSYADTVRAHEALQTYAFPGRRNLGYLFAFESKRQLVMDSVVTQSDGKKNITLPPTQPRFNSLEEFTRQGIVGNDTNPDHNDHTNNGGGPWALWTQVNSQYQTCMSYPATLVGPAVIGENPESIRLVRQCAAFRSEQRIPSLTWAARTGGGSLWRASQPKVGLQGNRSSADESFLKLIADSAAAANRNNNANGGNQRVDTERVVYLTGGLEQEWIAPQGMLKIMDLRPKTAAMANRTGGYGYENTSHYTCATIQFASIGNIHAVRDAYQKMSALCLSQTTSSDVNWNSLLEDTKWLSMIRLILFSSWQAAFYVHVHSLPVLLHCSHGWDRTSQVAALSQILLDPYYRTRQGFSCLVEKDFMSFGHPLHTRCAHGEGRGSNSGGKEGSSNGSGTANEGQISPVFLQFLDCVYQIVHQSPELFEFNTKYLLLLSEHIYSCRFGTVLCDTERERELVASIRQRTHCLWEYLDSREDLVNPSFAASSTSDDGGPLWMPLSALLRNVTLWADRHCMHGPKATVRALPESLLKVEKEKEAAVERGTEICVLRTADDYHALALEKATRETKKWKQIAEEREKELKALKASSGGGTE